MYIRPSCTISTLLRSPGSCGQLFFGIGERRSAVNFYAILSREWGDQGREKKRDNAPMCEVRFAPINGHRKRDAACPKCADCVEKLENHGAPKIPQMSRIGDFSRCKAL
jgi:hypothetical protein